MQNVTPGLFVEVLCVTRTCWRAGGPSPSGCRRISDCRLPKRLLTRPKSIASSVAVCVATVVILYVAGVTPLLSDWTRKAWDALAWLHEGNPSRVSQGLAALDTIRAGARSAYVGTRDVRDRAYQSLLREVDGLRGHAVALEAYVTDFSVGSRRSSKSSASCFSRTLRRAGRRRRVTEVGKLASDRAAEARGPDLPMKAIPRPTWFGPSHASILCACLLMRAVWWVRSGRGLAAVSWADRSGPLDRDRTAMAVERIAKRRVEGPAR